MTPTWREIAVSLHVLASDEEEALARAWGVVHPKLVPEPPDRDDYFLLPMEPDPERVRLEVELADEGS